TAIPSRTTPKRNKYTRCSVISPNSAPCFTFNKDVIALPFGVRLPVFPMKDEVSAIGVKLPPKKEKKATITVPKKLDTVSELIRKLITVNKEARPPTEKQRTLLMMKKANKLCQYTWKIRAELPYKIICCKKAIAMEDMKIPEKYDQGDTLDNRIRLKT